jgi:hypothetical protein
LADALADAGDFAAVDSSFVDPFGVSFVGIFDGSFAGVETSEAVVADGDDWIDCND